MDVNGRVGIGYDIHRLSDDRPLILGGVEIDYDQGLLGHSDADVVLHAVMDAMLGAAGLGDIGELYPDTDPKFFNADSKILLAEVVQKINKLRWTVANLDVIIHAEAPKLTGLKRTITDSIARLIGISAARVNVKAKTNEGLGPVGKHQAIACTAVILLASKNSE